MTCRKFLLRVRGARVESAARERKRRDRRPGRADEQHGEERLVYPARAGRAHDGHPALAVTRVRDPPRPSRDRSPVGLYYRALRVSRGLYDDAAALERDGHLGRGLEVENYLRAGRDDDLREAELDGR